MNKILYAVLLSSVAAVARAQFPTELMITGAMTRVSLTEYRAPILAQDWDQYAPHNDYVDAPVGCVPLSTAMVMAHFKWPAFPAADIADWADTNNLQNYTYHADSHLPFDWDRLLATYPTTTVDGKYKPIFEPKNANGFTRWRLEMPYRVRQAAARLGFACGVAGMADYEEGYTGTFTGAAAYGMANACLYEGPKSIGEKTPVDYANMKSLLDRGIPLIISINAHTMNADGYALDGGTNLLFHCVTGGGPYATTGWYSFSQTNGYPELYARYTTIQGYTKAFYPKNTVQYDPVPKFMDTAEGATFTLSWHYPDFYTNRLAGFELEIAESGWGAGEFTTLATLAARARAYTYTFDGTYYSPIFRVITRMADGSAVTNDNVEANSGWETPPTRMPVLEAPLFVAATVGTTVTVPIHATIDPCFATREMPTPISSDSFTFETSMPEAFPSANVSITAGTSAGEWILSAALPSGLTSGNFYPVTVTLTDSDGNVTRRPIVIGCTDAATAAALPGAVTNTAANAAALSRKYSATGNRPVVVTPAGYSATDRWERSALYDRFIQVTNGTRYAAHAAAAPEVAAATFGDVASFRAWFRAVSGMRAYPVRVAARGTFAAAGRLVEPQDSVPLDLEAGAGATVAGGVTVSNAVLAAGVKLAPTNGAFTVIGKLTAAGVVTVACGGISAAGNEVKLVDCASASGIAETAFTVTGVPAGYHTLWYTQFGRTVLALRSDNPTKPGMTIRVVRR